MVKGAIKKFLDIDKLESQVSDIDQRVKTVELRTETAFHHLGDYKNRTTKQLNRMRKEIDDLLDSVEAIVERAESKEATERARKLSKRLKLNKTLVFKALKSQGA